MAILAALLLPAGGMAAARVGCPGDESLMAAHTADEKVVALSKLVKSGRREVVAAVLREILNSGRAASPFAVVQALDGIVCLEDTESVPALCGLTRSGGGEIGAAAAMALDRLAQRQPLAVMRQLNQRPDLLADRPNFRADLYAKADPGSSEQMAEIEKYLADPARSVPERSKCLASMMQQGFIVGEGLFTAGEPLPRPSPGRSLAVKERLLAWRADRRFAALKPAIELLLEFP